MVIQERDILFLRFLRRYFYQRTRQLRDLVVPHDHDCAITRGRLRKLEQAGYVRRYDPKLIDPCDPQTASPVWALTLKGGNLLATFTGDCSLLLTVEPNFKDWMSVNHFCSLGGLGATWDRSIAKQSRVTLHAMYYEHEVIRHEADDPSKRYRLHTSFSGSNVRCCPDMAVEIELGGCRRALYQEREMGSDSPGRVSAVKHRGYFELARTQAFRHHFPHAGDFRVVAFCPNAGWRDSLRREMTSRPGAELWLFVSMPEVLAETLLSGAIVYTVDRGPFPLIPPAAPPPPEG